MNSRFEAGQSGHSARARAEVVADEVRQERREHEREGARPRPHPATGAERDGEAEEQVVAEEVMQVLVRPRVDAEDKPDPVGPGSTLAARHQKRVGRAARPA